MKAPSSDTINSSFSDGLLRSQQGLQDESSILLVQDSRRVGNGGERAEQGDPRGPIHSEVSSRGDHHREEETDSLLDEEGEVAVMQRPEATRPASAHIVTMGSIGLAAILSLILASSWILQLGGLEPSLRVTNKHVFNWHPLLMVAAFVVMTIGSLAFRINSLLTCNNGAFDASSSFRQRSDRRRRCAKLVHAGSWCLAATFVGVALVAVIRSHNNPDKPVANLYSMHSWIGLLVLVSYVAQLLVGLLIFYDWVRISAASKAWVHKIHTRAGPIIYACTALTILLGIQEKEGFVGCSYPVTEPDSIPFRHAFEIPTACWTSHSLGISVLLVTILTATLWVWPSSRLDGDGRRSR